MEVFTQVLSYILSFEIPFGSVTFKPIYLVYVSFAIALLKYLMGGKEV